MGKSVPWVQEDPKTGRLIYRRAYPEDVRPFLPKPGTRELKVPLGASRAMTASAFRTYEQSKRRFDEDVKAARSAGNLHAKKVEGARDALSPGRVSELAELFRHQWHSSDDNSLRLRGGEWADRAEAGWDWMGTDFQEWKREGDMEAMEDRWGRAADALLKGEGLLTDPDDHDGRERLLWALNDVALEYEEDARKRLAGKLVPIPPKPERQSNPRGRKRTVTALVDAYVADKWEGWSTSTRKAFAPVSKVLKDLLGDREVAEIDRETAREVYQLVQALPVNMSKLAVFKGMGVREAVEEAKRRGSPTIAPKTINEGYMVHIAGVFNWARREEWTSKSPFEGFRVVDPVHAADKRDPFTTDQLRTLFSSAPWEKRLGNDDEKPGRYWVPLIALLSGMRMAEIAGLRLKDIGEVEGIPAFVVRRYEGRGIKNKESRRVLPIHSELLHLGLEAFVAHWRSKAEPDDLLFPDGKANVRQQGGAKLGEWFSDLVNKEHEFIGTKLGMHSFRHNFEDRLKAKGVYGTAVGRVLSGRKIPGSEADYGSSFPIEVLQESLEKVSYPGLDLSHLKLLTDD